MHRVGIFHFGPKIIMLKQLVKEQNEKPLWLAQEIILTYDWMIGNVIHTQMLSWRASLPPAKKWSSTNPYMLRWSFFWQLTRPWRKCLISTVNWIHLIEEGTHRRQVKYELKWNLENKSSPDDSVIIREYYCMTCSLYNKYLLFCMAGLLECLFLI